MSVPGVNGIEHTGIVAMDTVDLSRWYLELFKGREVSRSEGDRPVIFLSFGQGALLELIPAPEEGGPPATDHVHLCFSVSSLNAAVAGLEERGIALDRPVFEAYEGSSVAFFRDPEGNLLQLVQRVPGSGVHKSVFGDV